MSKAPEPGIVDGSWFRRDRITGNFVHATPPLQFTHQELTAMLTEKFEAAALIKELVEALTKARDKFQFYEQLHRLKCTADGDEKADRNREMADELTAALSRAGANR